MVLSTATVWQESRDWHVASSEGLEVAPGMRFGSLAPSGSLPTFMVLGFLYMWIEARVSIWMTNSGLLSFQSCAIGCCAHRFPFSRPELLREWVLNIGRADFKPKQHTVICSEHFRPECFSAFGNRKNLKHNAVPTVFAFQNPTEVGC